MPDADATTGYPHPGSRRGVWTIVAIFALGFTVLGGLFLSPKSKPPPLPDGIANGLPATPISCVLLDCGPFGASPDAIVAGIRRLSDAPDLLLLVDIESSLVPPVIEAFGMQKSYHAELFQRSQASIAGGDKIGIVVLSKHGLFEGTPIRIDRRSIGVEAVMVVGGRATHVRCLAMDDGAAPPPGLAHPKALVGTASPVVLTAGRIGGNWKADVTEVQGLGSQSIAGALIETRREQAPVGIAFKLGEPARESTTGPAAVSSRAPSTVPTSPATDRAE